MPGTAARGAKGGSKERPRVAPPVAPAGDEPAKRDLRDLKARWQTYLSDKRLNTTAQREAIVEQFFRAKSFEDF